MLVSTCGDLLSAGDLGVVDVSAQFTRELFVGDVRAEASLIRLGVSSVSFRVVIYQEEMAGADITIVLARLADGRTRSTPLSPEQRAALETILEK
ncbi:hotdog domain-containing protein [Gordonia hydrophobica]|uniref:Hotdog domain-containing protein n=1 Tax=Gordonia hydrophobica TaxID=40516 RepID=A0ABZ2U0C1_9ACTN